VHDAAQKINRRWIFMGKLAGKKLILLGERDGVPGPAMEACLKDCGADIIFSATECFV
jgi:betaine reductase